MKALSGVIEYTSQYTGLTVGASRVIWWIVGALAAGTSYRAIRFALNPNQRLARRLGSAAVWWVMLAATVLGLALGRGALGAAVALVSLAAWVELVRLLGLRAMPRWTHPLFALAIVISVWLATLGHPSAFAFFLPAALLLGAPLVCMVTRPDLGYRAAVARLSWATLVCGYLLPHLLLLYTAPPAANPIGGPAGWFILVLLLTELNDIAQALVGKALGGSKITPMLSPNKTWAGLLGGVVTTAVVAVIVAPWLTPWDWAVGAAVRWPVLLGCVGLGVGLAVAGFLGDLSMSAVKRDAGVKDSSDLLPGQGGVLDRCDSLLFTAPLFYHALRWGLGDA